jgi:hypothetical protein
MYNRSITRAATNLAPRNNSVYSRWQGRSVVDQHPVSLRHTPPIDTNPRMRVQRQIPGRPDVYAGKDGEIYRHQSDGWYKRNGGKWEKFDTTPTTKAPAVKLEPPTHTPREFKPPANPNNTGIPPTTPQKLPRESSPPRGIPQQNPNNPQIPSTPQRVPREPIQPRITPPPNPTTQQLNREHQSRMEGTRRLDQFHNAYPSQGRVPQPASPRTNPPPPSSGRRH